MAHNEIEQDLKIENTDPNRGPGEEIEYRERREFYDKQRQDCASAKFLDSFWGATWAIEKYDSCMSQIDLSENPYNGDSKVQKNR